MENLEQPRLSYSSETPHPLQQLRLQITAFREYLASHGKRMLMRDPGVEPFLRRALRIPGDIPLLSTRAERWGQCLMLTLPLVFQVRRARALLQPVGTHEGRRFIFEQQINRTLPGQYYFSLSLDFALRKLHPPSAFKVLQDMALVDLEWMQACHQLGVRQMGEVNHVVKAQCGRRVNGALVLALVDLKVIRSVDTLVQLPQRSSWYYDDDQLTQDSVERFRQVVQLLRDAGVVPSSIVRLVQYHVNRFDPQRLNITLGVLGLDGAELSALFELVGEQLLLVKSERWEFLCNTLNVRSAADMGLFRRLLDSGRAPSREFALALRALGADVCALESCQSLILSVGDREDSLPPIVELQRLVAAPHSFTFAQLALAEDYLLVERDLEAYLQVLTRHGYGDAQSVLAFQRCYKQLSADTLNRWLVIADERVGGQSPAAVAEWVARAGVGGYIDAFDYLSQVGELRTFAHLHQALKLAPLGTPLLRYVREDRGLADLSALVSWYYNEAQGIKEVRLWGELDAVSRVLLDDAFERKNFALLEGNQASVHHFIGKRIIAALGEFPYRSEEGVREAYHKASRHIREEMGAEMAPRLESMLKETGGLLPLSVIVHIDEPVEQLRQRIAELEPMLSDLLAGGGPMQEALSDVAADLVAIVYRTTSSTVRNYWPQVIGREGDVAGLAARPYPMCWARVELQLDSLLDPRGLQSLAEALQFAAHFEACYREDMHAACHRLSPKRLHDPAADVWSLALHLGILMAIAGADSNVCEWLDQGTKTIKSMGDAGPLVYQQTESLHALFNLQLGDALDALETGFVERLAETDASVLASRLDRRFAVGSSMARSDLKQALAKTREVVVRIYLRWASLQKKRFTAKDVGGVGTHMQAVVSKTPAAFFAKEAAGICTRTNTAMWQEPRNAHLLIFAPGGKRLEGMALLYFERVPALDADRDTLIIRALNPMGDALASHGVSSIVDGYFDVAMRIAQDNDLAAVAFPCPMGMHLMSNHQAVENDIKERFMRPAQSHWRWGTEEQAESWYAQPRKVAASFYAYESGEVLVKELYAFWHAREHEKGTACGLMVAQV